MAKRKSRGSPFRRSSQSAESAAAPVETASRSTAGKSASSASSLVRSALMPPPPTIGFIGVAGLQRLLLTQSDDDGRRFRPAARPRLSIDHLLVFPASSAAQIATLATSAHTDVLRSC